MTRRPALVLALALVPEAAAAQVAEVGVGASLGYAQYLDVARQCCPPLVWAAFGSGRWRIHVDYLRSYREEEGHGNYPIDDVDGRRASVQRASLHIEPRHETSLLVSWRALERPGYSLRILFGAWRWRSRISGCGAAAGPVVRIPTPADWPSDYVVFRQELTPEERGRCADAPHVLQHVGPLAAVVLDVPFGERFFLRAGTRLLLRTHVGIGVKF